MRPVFIIGTILALIAIGCCLSAGGDSALARERVPTSSRVKLPEWLERPELLPLYIDRKYYQDPDSCETVRNAQWMCHIDCGETCRLDTLFDFGRRVEVMLPRTEASYFHIPKWHMLATVAFVPSARGWDFGWVWVDLDTLLVYHAPIVSDAYQPVSMLKLITKSRNEGVAGYYCFEDGACWHDELRFKRGDLVLKTHRAIDPADMPGDKVTPSEGSPPQAERTAETPPTADAFSVPMRRVPEPEAVPSQPVLQEEGDRHESQN